MPPASARANVTLHVGAGTFQPVRVDDTDRARHAFRMGRGPAGDGRRHRRRQRVVSIGTTALRLLESVARDGPMRAWTGETDIFITPGFQFQVVDLLLTNFHLPRSTLFMLVSAFAGLERMKSRLCARRRRAIPLLFLRRLLSVAAMSLSFRPSRHRRRSRGAAA